jgi:aconitate hydratase
MIRGTFANIRLRNQLVPGVEGGFTVDLLDPQRSQLPIYDAAARYRDAGVPLVVLAGNEYGTGSSRDWAAKGTALLGVRAVIAGSYERIHRSNLIGMGVLPLEYPRGESADSLGLTGEETFAVRGVTALNEGTTPREVEVVATSADGTEKRFDAVLRIDTPGEADYYRHGGILQYVLRSLLG